MTAIVDFQSATAARLVSESGDVLPIAVEKGQLQIAGVTIDAKMVDVLIATITAWQDKGDLSDLSAGASAARAYTMEQAAEVWKQRYLANKGTGDRITTGGKTARTIIGVGPDFFYLDGKSQLPYAGAAAMWTWVSDGAPVGMAK